ncbi:hypothetical protein [Streptomyces lavendulae]
MDDRLIDELVSRAQAETGDQDQGDSAHQNMGSANFDAARFGAR